MTPQVSDQLLDRLEAWGVHRSRGAVVRQSVRQKLADIFASRTG